MLLGPPRKAFKISLNYKCRKFLTVNFCKDSIYIRKSAIGYPAFLPVKKIIFLIRGKDSGCLGAKGVAAAVWFGKTVRSLPFPAGQFGDIFFLLGVCSKI